MHWLCLAALAATVAAQGSYDLDPRVSFAGKSSSLGPLYSSSLSGGQGFRDNSYEDNIVTPTPSPSPYRNPSNQQPVSNQIFSAVFFVEILLFPFARIINHGINSCITLHCVYLLRVMQDDLRKNISLSVDLMYRFAHVYRCV